jgi:hypothetical protein
LKTRTARPPAVGGRVERYAPRCGRPSC